MSDRSQSILDKFFAQALGEHIVVQGREERFKSLLTDLIDAELNAANPTTSDSGQPADQVAATTSDSEASGSVDPTQPQDSSASQPTSTSTDGSPSTPTETTSDGSSPSSMTEDPTTASATSSPAESPVSEETHAA